MLRKILNAIDPQTLLSSIDQRRLQEVCVLTGTDKSSLSISSNIVDYVLAIYGYDLLYDKNLRKILLLQLTDEKLEDLAVKCAGRKYNKKYDNAALLSSCAWRPGAKIVSELSRLFHIPAEYLPERYGLKRSFEIIEPVDSLLPLHDYQRELVDIILNKLSSNEQRFLIQLPTGSGKTRTLLEAIVEHSNNTNIIDNQYSILWLAHSEELCEQAIETMKKVWQNKACDSINVIRYWGGYSPDCVDVGGSFVVATFQKIYNALIRGDVLVGDIAKSTKLVVVDEAHKSIATTYAKAINGIVNTDSSIKLIGLTATPGRGKEKEAENEKLSEFYNGILISPELTCNPLEELRNRGVLSRVEHYSIRSDVSIDVLQSIECAAEDGYSDVPSTVLRKLSINSMRNKQILDIVVDEVSKGNPCLVFACTVEHARLLSAGLNLRNIKAGCVSSDMRSGSRNKIINGFRNSNIDVLINYGILSTGFDAPRIRTILITRPTSSIVLYSQMIGRGLRGPKMGGSEVCKLIDIRDNFVNYGGVDDVYTYFANYWK